MQTPKNTSPDTQSTSPGTQTTSPDTQHASQNAKNKGLGTQNTYEPIWVIYFLVSSYICMPCQFCICSHTFTYFPFVVRGGNGSQLNICLCCVFLVVFVLLCFALSSRRGLLSLLFAPAIFSQVCVVGFASVALFSLDVRCILLGTLTGQS